MKKLFITLVILAIPALLFSQGVDEAYLFAKENSFGTARSIGIGGAFGALGGDLSSININPAGLAVYRTSEATFSPSLQYGSTSSTYVQSTADDNRTKFSINQFGFVGVNQPMREATSGIINTNFAFNFQKTNDFNTSTQIRGNNNSSLADQFRYEAEGISVNNLNPLRSGLAYDTYMIDSLPGSYLDPAYLSAVEYLKDPTTIERNLPNGLDQWKKIRTSGRNYEMSGAAGINISNVLFLGASLNINFLSYYKSTFYSETDPRGNNAYMSNYKYNTELTNNGIGLNLKIGAIYKPINAIRLGVSFQTPTWYSMSEDYSATSDSYFPNGVRDIYDNLLHDNNGAIISGSTLTNENKFDYNYRTPLKLCASAAFILGEKIALSIDYKHIDYSTAKYHANVDDAEGSQAIFQLNNTVKLAYKATDNINAGIEFKPISNIAIRGGFILNESGIKNAPNSTYTYSCGFGYRNQNYFIDLAYRLQKLQSKHYIYQENQGIIDNGYNDSADVKNSTSLAVVTFGVKF